jgi:AcrR family transcriptional regulator
MENAAPVPKRARTAQQKSDRRAAILAAADRQFRQSGFEAFSMSTLARDSGVAKGTLYLYFATREEVLLALHNGLLKSWCADLAAALGAVTSDADFVELFFRTMRRDPIFLQLVARLYSVIEHKVSQGALLESKRLTLQQMGALSPRVQACLGLSAEQVFDLMTGLGALMLGAQEADAGPCRESNDLPEDLQQLVAGFAVERVFMPNARYILAGIRGRPETDPVEA